MIIWSALFIMIQLLDIITTLEVLGLGGGERNQLFHLFGMESFMLQKLITVPIIIFLAYLSNRLLEDERVGRYALAVMTLIITVAVINNTNNFLLLRG